VDEVSAPPKEDAVVHGLLMEGARWDEKAGLLEDERERVVYWYSIQ
jgi:hypothetical protein